MLARMFAHIYLYTCEHANTNAHIHMKIRQKEREKTGKLLVFGSGLGGG